MKTLLKHLLKKLPVSFTRNQKYDRQTLAIIKRACSATSNCIDIGCHKGEILSLMLQYAPKGFHYGFEPIPSLYQHLKSNFEGTNCSILPYAVSNSKGVANFNYVVSNPSYSGLRKRKYDRPEENDINIEVETEKLDNLIPSHKKIALIKIDVEGAEQMVLEGARELLKRDQPIVIFEHGLGASDIYESGPNSIFQLLNECNLKIYLLDDWLKQNPPLTELLFADQYFKKKNYVFIAAP